MIVIIKYLNKPVVLITGASSGLGFAMALRFAAEGYRVIAGIRQITTHSELVERAEQQGISEFINCQQVDVTDEAQVDRLVKWVEEHYGQLDVLVNNAGIAVGGMVEEVPIEALRDQLEINFFAVVRLTQKVLPLMRKQQSGTIMNISSISGCIGFPGYAPYCASKFALEGFSEALRLELLPFGIRVVLIEPGAYKTSIWQKGFAGMHTRPSSPYQSLLEAVLQYSCQAAETAPEPDEVARKAVQIAALSSPKLRYPIGNGVLASLIGKAVLPWRWYERIVLKMLNNGNRVQRTD